MGRYISWLSWYTPDEIAIEKGEMMRIAMDLQLGWFLALLTWDWWQMMIHSKYLDCVTIRTKLYRYAKIPVMRWMATDDCWWSQQMDIFDLSWMSWVTVRHLAEFWMIEPELAFADIFDDMTLAEAPTGRQWADVSCLIGWLKKVLAWHRTTSNIAWSTPWSTTVRTGQLLI